MTPRQSIVFNICTLYNNPHIHPARCTITELISPDIKAWLLDPNDPGPRYLALRDLFQASPGELRPARQAAHENGPISEILEHQHPDGYWVKPGAGYSPKYHGTVWSLIALAQCGASVEEDPRIRQACSYLLDHALAPAGQLCTNGAPSNNIDCLQGNLCASLVEMGVDEERLDRAYEWMARSVTGEGIAPNTEKGAPVRYYAYNCGPLFRCGPNNKLPCAWGGAKVLIAFSKLPAGKRTPLIDDAIRATVEFFFSVDPATAEYSCGYADKPSRNWWKFGFPVFYVADILQIAEGLVRLGYGHDPRLAGTISYIRNKADKKGAWNNEYNYSSKTWVDWGRGGQPNKWVTIRALRVLAALSG